MSKYTRSVQKLIADLPQAYSEASESAFNIILLEYRKILDGLSDLSEEYIENLWGHYSKLRTFETSMSTFYQLKTLKQKEAAFNEVRRGIQNDLEDLLALLKR